MKVEWKDSDFSVEKWKLNENVEMKTEFCKTKKNGILLAEAETK
jgi:hypothetical protein